MPRPSYGRSAAVLSVAAHVAIAGALLWGGAGLFETRAAEGSERRPAITWVALPDMSSHDVKTPSTPPVPAPTIAAAPLEPPRLDGPASLHAPAAGPLRGSSPRPLPGPVAVDEDVSSSLATRTNCGGVTEVRASYEADPSPDLDAAARDVFGPTTPRVPTTTAGAPPDDNREHDVQFWIRADGRVTRIAVSPPIRDSRYRRRFREAVSTFVFGPVQTPDGRPIDYVYSCVVYP